MSERGMREALVWNLSRQRLVSEQNRIKVSESVTLHSK